MVLCLALLVLASAPLLAAEPAARPDPSHPDALPDLIIPPNPFDKDGGANPGGAHPSAKAADSHLQCLGRKALAAATCKSEGDFNFLRQVDKVYVYSAFFGATDSMFYCDASNDSSLILSGKPWGSKRITATVHTDPKTGCAQASVAKSLCGTAVTVSCCKD